MTKFFKNLVTFNQLSFKRSGILYQKPKDRRNFITLGNFQRRTKEQKTPLSHTCFFVFISFIFRLIFRLWRHILKDSSPILEHLEIRECMVSIACIYFMKYQSFQHFILPELCLENKKHMARGGLSITLNCLSHELGASLSKNYLDTSI